MWKANCYDDQKITEIDDELSTLIKHIELIAIWPIDLIAHISFVVATLKPMPGMEHWTSGNRKRLMNERLLVQKPVPDSKCLN